MDITNETIGLKVLSVSPSHAESNVNVNSTIDITFTSDINPNTLTKNIVVFKDINKIYKNANSLRDYSKYEVVKGSISYENKILTYTPDTPFDVDSTYILMLNDKIADITGNQLIKKYINVFYTELEQSYTGVKIITPKYGLITNEIPMFEWENQKAPSYVFQISKENSFERLIIEDVIKGNDKTDKIQYIPSFKAEEGMYFIRIKCENSDWSETHQIFIKPITDAVIAEEDTSEMIAFEDFFENLEDPIEILEYFPEPNSINNSLKTNLIYLKIKGKIEEDRVDFSNCYIYGESLDDEHNEYSHESISGDWSVVYDAYLDVTYIIFTPDIMSQGD